MHGLPLFESIQRTLRESKRRKKIQQATTWPKTTAEINRWSVNPVSDPNASFSSNYQIEAGFHFTLNGEYYGGYAHSTPTSHSAAERVATGAPTLTIRYNPTNPDETAVLAEDNLNTLPFEVLSS
ncbi:DUF3592 domain-containing protein [Granulicella sibirica]|uniref:DUF3592 domain-containing protein n=1 Tax=Granulicella sibirica TaxID=2479048 RepID=A0A4Q0T0H0_9BACT|nr:DUF3592 domain-containing protein [Granulicella sibirica]RXH55830.1 hypothetical protein GRAN_2687 [Granulicella sibirica]